MHPPPFRLTQRLPNKPLRPVNRRSGPKGLHGGRGFATRQFDCHGDFIGFMLDDCCRSRVFKSRARSVGELVLKVCREDMSVSVVTDGRHDGKIRKITVRR
jgi:hypothetical protein